MPEQKETAHFESGRATAPPSVCYFSLLDSPSEEYSHSSAVGLKKSEQKGGTVLQSVPFRPNLNNFNYPKTQSSPDYSLCSSSLPYFTITTSKSEIINFSSQSVQNLTDYSHTNSSSILSCSSFTNSNNNNNNNNNNKFDLINININNSNNNNNTVFTHTSRISPPKRQENYYLTSETSKSTEHLSSTSFNYLKISKPNSSPTLKNISDSSSTLLCPNIQQKYNHNKESVDLYLEKTSKLKRNLEETQSVLKTIKDDNCEDLLQFFSKNGTKFKNAEDANQDLVTDSFIHLLNKKNSQDHLSCDLSDINSILVSLTNKYKSEEISDFINKDINEDFKLMNDFLTKILLEREEKRFKSADEKKNFVLKETFDDLSNELEEKKLKRDAMSHYQEDKNHHKRSSNYGDYNQWEYFGQQDIQSSNNHNRRGHFSFGGTSQQHSVGWNPMTIGMPRQSNPYYSNPHSHMMPAHAHSDYRYNQWNNPNHKNIPNVHNAHSQNTILPQTKMDIKHHTDISTSVQDFLPISSTSDFSKFRPSSRDLVHRTPPNLTEKSTRTGILSEHLTTVSPAIRNSSSMRSPPITGHQKPMINNPLSDLQMLVTNQESENLPQKTENFQQETVDLSAHSEISKHKENLQNKSLNGKSEEVKEFRSPVSVIQIQNKQVKSDFKDSEKPVELTSKSVEKNVEIGSSRPLSRNNLENQNESTRVLSSTLENESTVESAKETVQNKVETFEEPIITSVIVGKDEELSEGDRKSKKDIPENGNASKNEGKNQKFEDKNQEENVVQKKISDETDRLKVETKETQKCRAANENNLNELSTNCEVEYSENAESFKNCKRKAQDEQSSEDKKKVLLEVESQPEKKCERFEAENSDLPTVSSTSVETKPVTNEIIRKTPKKKPLRKSRIGRLSSGQSSGSERSLPCKKLKSSGNKDEAKKKMKKSLCDVMDRRGPFLHVEGHKESPISVIVVNFPKGDDEDEKEKSSVKKLTLNASRTKHHNELDYRGKSRNGLYSSTLSARYDARTTDHTWVCIFCKKGPHYNTMGDLFGPYIISKDENLSLGDFSGDEKDISDAQKRGGRNKKSLRSNNMVEHFQKMSRKLRRTQSTESCLTGMTVISDDQIDQLRYEVWVHEQCAVWSPNVFLIGSRIIGMQEAIWCSVKTMCSKCGISGANIGCVYRNCPNRSHYHCAKESGWSLEQDTFISTCHIHKPRS